MPRLLHVACLQTRPMPDFASAIAEALPLAREAAARGARFLLLPEYCGGLVAEGAAIRAPAAPEAEHPVLKALSAFAAERRVWVMAGSVAVPGPGGRILNRGVTLDDRGRVVARYDKLHLFDVRLSPTEVYAESASVAPGDRAVNVPTPWGIVGHTICYDLRFPHLYRALAQAGAEMLAVPAAFTAKTGAAHWHVLNRARAIENGAFVLSPCASGPVPGGGAAYGHSLIVGPWGEVIADAGEGPGVVSAEIDLEAVAEARRRIPSLAHDRPFHAPEPARTEAAA
jgi:predicted amidohydrolase